MLRYQVKFHAIHDVNVVLAIIAPDHKCSVLLVAQTVVGLLEKVALTGLVCDLEQFFLFYSQFITFWDLFPQDFSRFFKFLANVVVSDSVKYLFKQALCPKTFDAADHGLLFFKIALFSGGLTPATPCFEFHIRSLGALLVASML